MANNENLHETLLALQNQLTRLQLEVETLRNNITQNNENNDNNDNESNDENSSEQSEAACNPIVASMSSLKAYLEMITEFDGNNISVETFIFGINSMLNDIQADQKTTFLRLIISKKIIRNARKMIDGNDIRTSDDLFQVLRNYFGENKSYDVSLLERSQCQQGRDNVTLYNKRFNEYHANVKRSINNNCKISSTQRHIILANEEEQGLSQYIRGLRSNIKIFVKSGKPETIRQAQNLALETEKEEEISRALYPRMNNNFGKNNETERSQNTFKQYEKPQNTFKQYEKSQINTVPQSVPNSKFPCHGCGSFSHFIKDCPKRPTYFQPQNFQNRRQFEKPPIPINYTQCQENETLEQPLCSESAVPMDNENTHSWQTPGQQQM
ncbi:GATA zinc finger domain-containing protein 8-like [Aphidius gifuensis]|uniref:GATA zinc finger domain-containing protein 8-like n=1 Tax=Aphidius gifuensis TaxID=684658 RepID=UPI001CDC60DE|nr:GATA zinc finger domain-containing protein 8-like [Aphidius gifuensis]